MRTVGSRRRGMAVCCAGTLLLLGCPALAVIEPTTWGPFDFPAHVRTQREAQAQFAEAKVPIVIAVRFLAGTERPDAPWLNRHLACNADGAVRADFAAALVRASTLLAQRLVVNLERGRTAAAALRAGQPPGQTVRYGGPVALVLEPVTLSAAGDALPPIVTVEPHLRVFVSAAVPRCASDASGAFGRAGEIDGAYLVTAAPALELGWPTYSASALGQRVVMATENLLTEGFCCGQESNFGLESLLGIHDFRDYQTKARLKKTLRTLAAATRRDAAWTRQVRDAFGIPERFPASNVRSLSAGAGRIATGEFVIWPTQPEKLGAWPAAAATRQADLSDMLLSLAWHAHTRAELISPVLLETYDPERKYSFVGWPEEFRDAPDAMTDGDDAGSAVSQGGVLEVFGADRKYSFVGQPDAIARNIAFAFAAWASEIELLERSATQPFLALYAAEAERARALAAILATEADVRQRGGLQSVFSGRAPGPPGLADYQAAVRVLSGALRLPGLDSAPQLRATLRQKYRDQFREQLGGLQDAP